MNRSSVERYALRAALGLAILMFGATALSLRYKRPRVTRGDLIGAFGMKGTPGFVLVLSSAGTYREVVRDFPPLMREGTWEFREREQEITLDNFYLYEPRCMSVREPPMSSIIVHAAVEKASSIRIDMNSDCSQDQLQRIVDAVAR